MRKQMTTNTALGISDERAEEIIRKMRKIYEKGAKEALNKNHNWALDFKKINETYKYRNEAIFAIYSLTQTINIFSNQREKLSIGELLCDLFSREFGGKKCQ